MSVSEMKKYMNNRHLFSLVKIFGIGIFVGIANVVPGVSGGTIAVICNVYEKLMILSSLKVKQIKEEWQTHLALGFGIGIGIVLFAKVMTLLYTIYPTQTSFFFIGIILGSFPFLYRKVRFAITHKPLKDGTLKGESLGENTQHISHTTVLCSTLLCALLGFSLMLWLFFLKHSGVHTPAIIPTLSAAVAIKLAAMGVLAAAAMLLPGISGSFVLAVLGAYQVVLHAVADFNIPLLIPFGLGVLTGLICAARLITIVLEKYPAPMYSFILGLVAGSILYLYPVSCQPFPMRMLSALALFVGYSLITFFSKREQAEN